MNATAALCHARADELFARAHYLDAQRLYERASRLEPQNAAYAADCERLSVMAFAFFKKGSPKGAGGSEAFCDCCCECCGEGCCEGLCEGLCEGCDCS